MSTLLYRRNFPRPVIVTVLDIIPRVVRYNKRLTTQSIAESVFYEIALNALSKADAIVAISEYTKSCLTAVLEVPENLVHVIYPSIDRSRFYPKTVPEQFFSKYGLARGHPYLLYVGSEDPRKNLETLLHAFAIVKRSIPDVSLLKVGTEDFPTERLRLLRVVEELRLGNDVTFIKQVAEEDLPLFYNIARVFVFPSLHEGFGLPLLEAMASGTPVVASWNRPIPEVVGRAARLVDPSKPEEFAKQIVQVLTNSALTDELTAAGLERASHFDDKKQAGSLLKLYAKVAASS
jgi:glycosyltransferase involved in cell wall biosynthesis